MSKIADERLELFARTHPVYSEEAIEHFRNPRNAGEIKEPDGYGMSGDMYCSDVVEMTILVDDSKIRDIMFMVFGCPGAICTSSMFTETVKGMEIEKALEITEKDIANRLGRLPIGQMHCSGLAIEAFRKAVEDFRKKKGNEK